MMNCSFCDKNQKLVKKIIAGPDVCICDECVSHSACLIAEQDEPVEESTLIATLTDDRAKLFEENVSCIEACKEVVLEAISHWEKAKIAEKHLWKKIKFSYCNLMTKEQRRRVSYDYVTGELRLFSPGAFLKSKADVTSIIDDRWIKTAKDKVEDK